MIIMTVIDGTDLVLGRMASIVTKRLLANERIDLINSEKIIIIGDPVRIFEKYKVRLTLNQKGDPEIGPKFPKMPERIVKRAVQGMLPMKSSRGKTALKYFKAYIGKPAEFEGNKIEKLEKASKHLERSYERVGNLSKKLGAKW